MSLMLRANPESPHGLSLLLCGVTAVVGIVEQCCVPTHRATDHLRRIGGHGLDGRLIAVSGLSIGGRRGQLPQRLFRVGIAVLGALPVPPIVALLFVAVVFLA